MRIDTHAHAFPDLAYWSQPWPAPLRLAVKAAAGTAARIASLAPASRQASPRLSVERVAGFRRQAPASVNKALEMSAGIALLPALLSRGGIEDLLASMQRHQIDRTVVIGSHPSAPNAWLLEQAALHPDRIIAVAHPPSDTEASEIELLEAYDALASGGAAGFKIHYNLDGLPPDAATYRAMFEVAREYQLFVIVHTGCFHTVAYKHQRPSSPEIFEDYYRDYPQVRVCLAHMNRDQPDAALALLERYGQLYTDTSWQTAESVRHAVDRLGTGRIVLGSDWPLLHAELQGDCLDIVRRACSEPEIESIVHTAAESLVGGPVAASPATAGD